MVLTTSVASKTSTDMITLLASMTSTTSLASKNKKLLTIYILSDFPSIRNLSSLNDLNSLNNLNSLNDLSGLNSLISSKHLLRMMLPLTWWQNDLSWSPNVEWIIKNPLFYGFLALFEVWGCGGQECYFQPNPSVISQNSTSHESTDTIFMT